MPPSLEATLLEPAPISACPRVCAFNGSCPTRVQRAAEKLWVVGTLTPENFRTACYRYPHLADLWTAYTGRVDVPIDADGVREVLVERLAIEDPPAPTPREAAATDPEALALQERFMRARDRARQARDAETQAAHDAAHPQQELGV